MREILEWLAQADPIVQASAILGVAIDHLRLGTQAENNADRHRKGRTKVPVRSGGKWTGRIASCLALPLAALLAGCSDGTPDQVAHCARICAGAVKADASPAVRNRHWSCSCLYREGYVPSPGNPPDHCPPGAVHTVDGDACSCEGGAGTVRIEIDERDGGPAE